MRDDDGDSEEFKISVKSIYVLYFVHELEFSGLICFGSQELEWWNNCHGSSIL